MEYPLYFGLSLFCVGLLVAATLLAFSWWRQARYREALWLATALLFFLVGDAGNAMVFWMGQHVLFNEPDGYAWYTALSRFAFIFTLMGAALLPYAFWRLWRKALLLRDEQIGAEAHAE